ncbi:MAG: hypothetical protein K6G88_12705 [Lachnospiraceae bacterium]|nr:hypothetical protein [Lachnospiraceae bacterium]
MNKEFVSISDFAESRGQSSGTVNAFIRKHPEIDKNCKREGKEKFIEVDSEGYKLLDEKYPYVKPVQIVQDAGTMQDLIEAQKQIIELQKQLNESVKLVAQAEAIKLLLEDKEVIIQEKERSIEEAESRLKTKNDEIGRLQEKIREKNAEEKKCEIWAFLNS